MTDAPYWSVIQEHWDAIMMMYKKFRPKDQIIELEVTDQKIYSYPRERLHRQAQRTNSGTDPDCGRRVSRLAKSCPNCGRPFSSEGEK